MEENFVQDSSENPVKLQEKKASNILIVFSALSLIPAIGILFGAISILISLFNFKRFKIVFILGVSGIMLTVILYSTLSYFGEVQRGGVYDKLRVTTDIVL